MAPPRWDELASTGVDSMDAEHRLQVSLVKALEELVQQGADPAVLERTVSQLVDFTSVHFLSEELMMRLYAYPQHDAHKLEHARLKQQVDELRSRLAAGGREAGVAIVAELHAWLVGHVRTMDQAFASWCAKNGILAH
ncbi:MAG TPA: hemerythrin family protein [Anaeromyxobacteraceae bacterium]|nr:hemerythrin family protein [Anaeromyxobacteraceae bacterium]